jgi:hypothetical protein
MPTTRSIIVLPIDPSRAQDGTILPNGRVAFIEIVSPGNKASRYALRSFVDKAIEVLYSGCHLLLVDLHPPGARDRQGIHGAIWAQISDGGFAALPEKPLTLAAYSAEAARAPA